MITLVKKCISSSLLDDKGSDSNAMLCRQKWFLTSSLMLMWQARLFNLAAEKARLEETCQ